MAKRSFWGWGFEGVGPDAEQRKGIATTLSARFGTDLVAGELPTLDAVDLPPTTVSVPGSLAETVSTDAFDRASHTYGKSYRDVVRGFRGDFAAAPAAVAFPADEADVARVLDWCESAGLKATPFGGGSSVVGGVELAGAVSVDLSRLDKVLEIDRTSRAARVQAGTYGPALEDQLRPHGLTLRHFPQSFEFSTVGGWIATRSGGHYATNYTHIDDFVESLRVVTPRGIVESRRLPGSGAGPSPDRMFIGSEGILGVITEAWLRVQDRPTFRASAAVTFASLEVAAEAARALAQSALFPSNCRVLDPTEAMTSGAGDGSSALLLVGFESADHPLDAWIARAAELCRDHGGDVPDDSVRTRTDDKVSNEGATGQWRNAFIRAPYARDALVTMSVITDTFETSITWDRFPAFHESVMAATKAAMDEVGAGAGWMSCRFTHVYPDGPAPYYTFIGPGRPGAELEQWEVIKRAAGDAVIAGGGTITHHHAVGRDHRPWYDRQRPDLFADALRAAKATLDPNSILNPGVLLDP